jgi:hypothetical protein
MKVDNSLPLDEGNIWEALLFMMVSNFLVLKLLIFCYIGYGEEDLINIYLI